MKLRVLFTTPILQHPPKGGPELRIENSIKALARITELHLCARLSRDKMGGVGADTYYKQFVRSLAYSQEYRPRGVLGMLSRVQTHFARRMSSSRLAVIRQEQEFAGVLATAKKVRADVIWMGYGNISYPLLHYLKAHTQLPVVVDTDSVWSRFVLRESPYVANVTDRRGIMDEGTAKELEERQGTALADVTTAVSEVDAAYYRQFVARPGQVQLFSNAIDPTAYNPLPPAAKEMRCPAVYLAGSFYAAQCPMVDAVHWLLKDIMPLVWKQRPEVSVVIVGKGSDTYFAGEARERVRIMGQVDSVLPYLGNADVVVVPLRYESGTRFKILEAGACRRAVVSTTLGAEGLDGRDEEHLLIADGPDAFAHAILRILSDKPLGCLLGGNLHSLVAERYSISALAREGQTILDYLHLPAVK